MTAAELLLQRHQSAFPSLPVFPFYPFSSFSPTVSLGFLVDIPSFFGFSVSVVPLSLSVGFSLFRFLSPFAAVLPSFLCLFPFPPLSSSFRVIIYRGRGSGVDPAPSHRCPCMGRASPALLWRRLRWPMEASLAGHDFSVCSS